MVKGENMFFTTITEPRDFRRSLLESSKEILTVLKEYHILLEMRKEKQEKVQELRAEFDELDALLEQLDKFVPDDAVKQLEDMLPKPKPKPKPKKAAKKKAKNKTKKKGGKKKEKKEEKKPESPIDKLEKALSQIESKLEKV